MKKPFSRFHKTYKDWGSHTPPSPYKRRIERAHALHPQASLSQLRGHPKTREAPIGTLKSLSKSKIMYQLLKPKEREIRDRSLDVLSSMRLEGTSLTKAAKEVGTTPDTVRRYTNALKKVDQHWKPKSYDVIPRLMWINENGETKVIQVVDSRHASLIGRYHSAVGRALNNRDGSHLIPFRDRHVRDIEGHWHYLECDLHQLYLIQERRPHEEFFPIYAAMEGD